MKGSAAKALWVNERSRQRRAPTNGFPVSQPAACSRIAASLRPVDKEGCDAAGTMCVLQESCAELPSTPTHCVTLRELC